LIAFLSTLFIFSQSCLAIQFLFERIFESNQYASLADWLAIRGWQMWLAGGGPSWAGGWVGDWLAGWF